MTEAVVAGRGLAALTCALLLARQGRRVRVLGTADTRARLLVLPDEAARLLAAVCGADPAGSVPGWRLERRRVRWGDTGPQEVPAAGHVIDGAALTRWLAGQLAARFRDRVCFDAGTPPSTVSPAAGRWLVTATPGTAPARFGTVGRRRIITAEAGLTRESSTCRVATSGQGWVFLAPAGEDVALVQAMVPGPVAHPLRRLGDLLAETGLDELLARPPGRASVVEAAPGLLAPLCGPGWFAVGTAAVRFDPLCGSGTAQAVRTAILAAAAIGAIEEGDPVEDVFGYYAWRLQRAFTEHLRSCLRLYGPTFPGQAWRDEIEVTALALSTPPAGPPPAGFTLSGLSLRRPGLAGAGVSRARPGRGTG